MFTKAQLNKMSKQQLATIFAEYNALDKKDHLVNAILQLQAGWQLALEGICREEVNNLCLPESQAKRAEGRGKSNKRSSKK